MVDKSKITTERQRGFGWVVVGAFTVAILFFLNGLLIAAHTAWASFPDGEVAHVRHGRGWSDFWLVDGSAGEFPHDVLALAGRKGPPLIPGNRVAKKRWSFTYELNGQQLGGAGWHLRQWLPPTLIPAAVATILFALWCARTRAPRTHGASN